MVVVEIRLSLIAGGVSGCMEALSEALDPGGAVVVVD